MSTEKKKPDVINDLKSKFKDLRTIISMLTYMGIPHAIIENILIKSEKEKRGNRDNLDSPPLNLTLERFSQQITELNHLISNTQADHPTIVSLSHLKESLDQLDIKYRYLWLRSLSTFLPPYLVFLFFINKVLPTLPIRSTLSNEMYLILGLPPIVIIIFAWSLKVLKLTQNHFIDTMTTSISDNQLEEEMEQAINQLQALAQTNNTLPDDGIRLRDLLPDEYDTANSGESNSSSLSY